MRRSAIHRVRKRRLLDDRGAPALAERGEHDRERVHRPARHDDLVGIGGQPRAA